MIVEVGLLLDKPLEYYHEMLLQGGAINTFSCVTHDIYWSKTDFAELEEHQIKASCVRYRCVKGIEEKEYPALGDFQNYNIFDSDYDDNFTCQFHQLPLYELLFKQQGWKKVFDTTKRDYQYQIGNMKSRIQLQEVDNIGLVLYYDNPNLYNLPKSKQRKALIDELNTYGFEVSHETLGVDKLRSLHKGQLCFSDNQAG